MNFVALFFTGAFFCNALPHLCSGLMGQPFPTPFAKPSGIGDSSPFVNVLWAFLNLVIGLFLLSRWPVIIEFRLPFITLLVGGLAMGAQLSLHFGKVRGEKSTK